MKKQFFISLILLLICLCCAESTVSAKSKLELTSTAFEHKGLIPQEYTCIGANISPPLTIGNVPKETKTLAIVMTDLDNELGEWTHWVVYNIRPDEVSVADNAAFKTGTFGINDYGELGYKAPCPDNMKEHRYLYEVYAIDELMIDLVFGTTKSDLEEEIKKHILAKGELLGTFRKPIW